ncbi:hypothetical protein GX411_02725 [Candidatus Fermentibacteria bacterium]|nr:hypothetical protein [Candidatus Fermentibacteria bacterium]
MLLSPWHAAAVLIGTGLLPQAPPAGPALLEGRFITVEILQDVTTDYAEEVIGLDCPWNCDYIFFVSDADGMVFKASLDCFGQIGGFDLATTNADAFDYSSIQSLPEAKKPDMNLGIGLESRTWGCIKAVFD